jgi:hypothetical protein
MNQVNLKPGNPVCIKICIDQVAGIKEGPKEGIQEGTKGDRARKPDGASKKTPATQTQHHYTEARRPPKTFEELKAEADEYDQLINGSVMEPPSASFINMEESYLTKYMDSTHPLMTAKGTLKTLWLTESPEKAEAPMATSTPNKPQNGAHPRALRLTKLFEEGEAELLKKA